MQKARERARGRPVARIKVRVSALLRAEPESMSQAFSMIGTGTEFDGAELELVTIPGQGVCAACGEEMEVLEPWQPCSACGLMSVEVTNADEMILEEVEYRPTVETG